MKIVYARTYLLPSSHLTFESVTPWADGTFTVDSGIGPHLEHATLAEIEASGGVWGPVVADIIQRNLLSDVHDACGYRWKLHPCGDGFFMDGRCRCCGKW